MLLNNINKSYIEKYIYSILPQNSEYLQDMELYAEENHIPIVEKETAQFLKVLLKAHNPMNILEIGTAIGYSALIMAASTDRDCNITTIERQLRLVELAKNNIDNTSFKNRIKIMHGGAEEILLNLNESFDFIFIDAAKGHYLDFFNESIKRLSKGGIIVSDNVLYKGMVANDELVPRRKKTIVKRMRNYLNHITNLDGYITSVIPLGDGVALTYKEE